MQGSTFNLQKAIKNKTAETLTMNDGVGRRKLIKCQDCSICLRKYSFLFLLHPKTCPYDQFFFCMFGTIKLNFFYHIIT